MTWNIVFLGSPEFAVPSLQALVDDPRFDVRLVVSQPDRPAGRGRRCTPPPVALYANTAGLPLFQPESLKDDAAVAPLASAEPDLLVVVAYGEILRRAVLQLASGGALNVHPSLLPKYRGANPVASAILHGDEQTGISVIKLIRRLDAGPIVAQKTMGVDDAETTATLEARLAELAARMLPDTCDAWLCGDLEATAQDDALASYTREWTKADAEIDWSRPASEIERLIRATIPWPVAWTTLDGLRIQIRAATVAADDSQGRPAGEVFRHGKHILVSTGDGVLQLATVQPQGKKAIPAMGWWNGLQSESPRFSTKET